MERFNAFIKARTHRPPATKPRRARLGSEYHPDSSQPVRKKTSKRGSRISLEHNEGRDHDPPNESACGKLCVGAFNSFRELIGLTLLICAATTISLNLVNLLLLLFAFILCVLAFPNSYQTAKRSYIASVSGLCIFLVLYGAQIYAAVAVLVNGLTAVQTAGAIGKLVRAAGIGMSKSKSKSDNALAGLACFFPNAIAICAFIWLIIYYQSEKNARRQEPRWRPPPAGLVWLYSTKTWCYLCLLAMLLSACLSVSAVGAVMALIVYISLTEWLKLRAVESSRLFLWLSYPAILLALTVVILSTLMRVDLFSSLVQSQLVYLSVSGVQVFASIDGTAVSHYAASICIVVTGIFYHRLRDYLVPPQQQQQQSEEQLLKLPSAPLFKQPLLVGSPKEEQPKDERQPLVTSSNRARKAQTFQFQTIPPKRPKSAKSLCSRLKDILREYFVTPYLFIYLCQCMVLLWVIRYNSVWSIPQLVWLCYSTIYGSDVVGFMRITKRFLFPFMIVKGAVLYGLSIPNIQPPSENTDFWKTIGFLRIRSEPDGYPFLDFGIIACTLLAFFAAVRCENQYVAEQEGKHKHISKLLKSYPNLQQICVLILKNLDKGIIVYLYFLGLYSVSILHAGLVAYFLLYFIYPNTGRRCFVFLLLYMELFFALKLVYGIFSYLVTASELKGTVEVIAVILGIYAELLPDVVVRRVYLQVDFIALIILAYLQYKLYNSDLYRASEVPF